MKKIAELLKKYREQISYLFFGGLTTLVNIAAYWLLARAGLSTGIANAAALALSILFAYITNRLWVFESKTRGLAALKELAYFIACRLGTGLVDQGIMVAGVDHLGPALFPGADLELWGVCVKVVSNVIVIILNYIFSKLIIFRKQKK